MGVKVPIIPGLLPVLSLAQVQRITSLCKAKLPTQLLEKLGSCSEDAAAQIEIGVEHATRQCEGLLRAGVAGVHFYVLNKSEPQNAARVLDNVRSLLPSHS